VQWQDRINELKALEPKSVYPGHGTPGGPELLDQTMEYLKFFHDTVGEHVKAGAPVKITAADFADIKRKMLAHYPKLGRAELLDRSIPAEYTVQLSSLPAAQPQPETVGGSPTPAGSPAPSAATPAPAAAPTPPPAASSGSSGSTTVDDLLGDTETPGKKGKKKKK
jgi:hypothetical protein